MKCVQVKNQPYTVIRVKDNEAKRLVEEKNYEYCPKSTWKRIVRDAGKKKLVGDQQEGT